MSDAIRNIEALIVECDVEAKRFDDCIKQHQNIAGHENIVVSMLERRDRWQLQRLLNRMRLVHIRTQEPQTVLVADGDKEYHDWESKSTPDGYWERKRSND